MTNSVLAARITYILEQLVARLPESARPIAKAVLPGVLALVLAVGSVVVTGNIDPNEVKLALGGIAWAFITYWTPNLALPPGLLSDLKQLGSQLSEDDRAEVEAELGEREEVRKGDIGKTSTFGPDSGSEK